MVGRKHVAVVVVMLAWQGGNVYIRNGCNGQTQYGAAADMNKKRLGDITRDRCDLYSCDDIFNCVSINYSCLLIHPSTQAFISICLSVYLPVCICFLSICVCVVCVVM